MTEPTTPSWYDLLDVAPDASEAEIRAAWKVAIADLDPTDRRFRVRNQAAEVLLDKKRRAAYDAELAAQRKSEQQETAEQTGEDRDEEPGAPATGTAIGAPRRVVPAWLLAGVAVLTAVAVGAAAWVYFALPSDASVEESTRAAQSAAERAVGPILSYDYRHLDEDQAAAESYMTSGYRQNYDKLFAVVKQNAPSTKTVVTGKVISSGIVRSGTDRVEVLLFVDQSTTNKQNKGPVVYKNQVRAQMEKVGGDWLVDCLITTPNGSCD
ncbi:J domain-containing protein [Nocardioides ungokensis]|uniref:J domain-containing protein n=1 Tax=Nocardioides ungokensis TaxID=1643322 RepID=UPI0015DF583D|nr:DnaJ domain-containing protein [Nocardioides ungokensis]